MRLIPVTTIMLASVSLAPCSHTWKLPEITYDPIAAPQPATPEVEPPNPDEIVQIPTPLPQPGQLPRIPPTPPQTDPQSTRLNFGHSTGFRIPSYPWKTKSHYSH